jgi:hypothetical protein
MSFLRRALHAQATVWALAGFLLLIAPVWLVERLTGLYAVHNLPGTPPLPGTALLRMLGAQSIGLAMLMVLVARRLKDLWWWSWAFALVSVALAVIAVLNAAFGMVPGQSAGPWWILGAVCLVLAAAILWGLAVTAQQNPP